jgi:hypothetical protein
MRRLRLNLSATIPGGDSAEDGGDMAMKSDAAKAGIGFGTALAITISWSLHKSIFWAILHGIFSWFYVIYFAIRR